MRDGRIQQLGAPEELYTRPDNLYVARFMGYRHAFSAKTESLGDDGAVVSAGEMRFCGLPWRSPENVASLAFRAEDVQLAARGIPAEVAQDRKSVVSGTRVSGSVDRGGRRC